jgi:hypothetical protein
MWVWDATARTAGARNDCDRPNKAPVLVGRVLSQSYARPCSDSGGTRLWMNPRATGRLETPHLPVETLRWLRPHASSTGACFVLHTRQRSDTVGLPQSVLSRAAGRVGMKGARTCGERAGRHALFASATILRPRDWCCSIVLFVSIQGRCMRLLALIGVNAVQARTLSPSSQRRRLNLILTRLLSLSWAHPSLSRPLWRVRLPLCD